MSTTIALQSEGRSRAKAEGRHMGRLPAMMYDSEVVTSEPV
jgi:hypothetical protein